MFGTKKNCYVLLRERSGDLTPIPGKKEGTKVSYMVGKTEHTVPITFNTHLRFKGLPVWELPEGKGEFVNVLSEKFESAITDRTVDDLIQDNSMEQFLTFARSAGRLLAQNWLIIAMVGVCIALLFWTNNTAGHAADTANRIWNQVRPTPTAAGTVVTH